MISGVQKTARQPVQYLNPCNLRRYVTYERLCNRTVWINVLSSVQYAWNKQFQVGTYTLYNKELPDFKIRNDIQARRTTEDELLLE